MVHMGLTHGSDTWVCSDSLYYCILMLAQNNYRAISSRWYSWVCCDSFYECLLMHAQNQEWHSAITLMSAHHEVESVLVSIIVITDDAGLVQAAQEEGG